jgi:hypothetical protein
MSDFERETEKLERRLREQATQFDDLTLRAECLLMLLLVPMSLIVLLLLGALCI